MTDLDQIIDEMDLSPTHRAQLAAELLHLRRIAAACRAHRRRLPARVQAELERHATPTAITPPPDNTSPRLI
jgi:hypothetical protein